MTAPRDGPSLRRMVTSTGAAAALRADAYVRGEPRRTLDLAELRGAWVVLVFAARVSDVLELAWLEEAFAAGGAVVLATTTYDWHDTAERYGAEATVRFPVLTGVSEHRRVTAIVDPGGVVRHVGPRRSARDTLDIFEAQLVAQLAA
jgi:hypothetical protein